VSKPEPNLQTDNIEELETEKRGLAHGRDENLSGEIKLQMLARHRGREFLRTARSLTTGKKSTALESIDWEGGAGTGRKGASGERGEIGEKI